METRKFEIAIEALKKSNPENYNEFYFLQHEIFFDIIVENLKFSDPKYRKQLAKKQAKRLRHKPAYSGLSNNQIVKKLEHDIIIKTSPLIQEIKKKFFMEE